MKKHTNMRSWLVAGLLLTAVATAQASPIVIFDDDLWAGWSKAWNMNVVEDSAAAHSGTSYLTNTDNGQMNFQHAGLLVGTNTTLSMWINTSDGLQSNALEIRLTWYNTATEALHNLIPFDSRDASNPVIYFLDGVPVQSGFRTDADGTTWQHLTLDITQTAATGWPYEYHTFDPATSELRYIRLQSDTALMADTVRLIPEPGAASLLLLGAAGLILRRRRRRG